MVLILQTLEASYIRDRKLTDSFMDARLLKACDFDFRLAALCLDYAKLHFAVFILEKDSLYICNCNLNELL